MSCTKIKKSSVSEGDQDFAKYIWCLEQALRIQDKYIEAFNQMKTSDYYNAWCTLEKAEITLKFIKPHFPIESLEFHLWFIDKHVKQYQKLFPYKIFISPEFLHLGKICSICKAPISIRKPCAHKIGEIYNGEMCGWVITELSCVGMALVEKPVQKYSVMFPVDAETNERKEYDYSLLDYLMPRLTSPFHNWDVVWETRRHPHSLYSHIKPQDKCPCESGRRYKKCCLTKSGVLRPHCKFLFSVPPDDHKRRIEYL